ncbi:MAG TPA: DUF3592 domain-containing protein [Acetobacteraceae bacterium]|nr:DUF3592 domain-containing protein [Acetobacteraceae bacterium]
MSASDPEQPKPRKRPVVLIGLALAAGLGFAWLAWQPVAELRRLAATGVRVEARVPSVEEQRRRSGSTYYPILVFRASDGRVVRERSAVAVASPQAYLGRTVTVVYDPANPSSARPLDTLADGAGAAPWIAGSLAVLAFALAGFLMLAPRRERTG